MNKIKILHLEDLPSDVELVEHVLSKSEIEYEKRVVDNQKDYETALNEFYPDIVLSDHSLPSFNSYEALQILKETKMQIPFILITATVSEEYAVNIMKTGANDYILKDRLSRLPAAILSAIQQQKADQELHDYKFALDQSAILTLTDKDWHIKYVNENFCKISKYTAAELVGQNHNITNSGVHSESYINELRSTIAAGKIWRGELSGLAKDKSIFWVDKTIVPFFDSKGNPKHFLGIQFDITQRKKAEAENAISQLRLKEAHALAQISTWEIDLLNNMHIWSDEFYKLFGLNKSEVKPSQKLIKTLMHPNDVSMAQQKIKEGMDKHLDSHLNFSFNRPDGITKHVYAEWKFEFSPQGQPIRLYGILQDVTERKEAFEKLKSLELKILDQKIKEEKNITKAILKAQDNERYEIGGELHDNVCQILAAAQISLSMLDVPTDPQQLKLINQCKEYSNLALEEIRNISHRLAPVFYNDMALEEGIKRLLSTFNFNGTIKVILNIDKALSNFPINPEIQLTFYRILQEQIRNIEKHAKANLIELGVSLKEDVIILKITDNGIGFDKAKIKDGIGIANMRRRTEHLSGNFEMNSSPGNGCTVTIEIPLILAPVA